jgi:hypothetical protein
MRGKHWRKIERIVNETCGLRIHLRIRGEADIANSISNKISNHINNTLLTLFTDALKSAQESSTFLQALTHAAVLAEASGVEILRLYKTQVLATKITLVKPLKLDICINTCIAYTGEYKDRLACPFVQDGKVCGEPQKAKPRA